MQSATSPKVFISYSWTSDNHCAYPALLATAVSFFAVQGRVVRYNAEVQ